jgi:hypothetical protein
VGCLLLSAAPAAHMPSPYLLQARKLRRAVDAVQPLLQAAQSDLEYLEELEASVQLLGSFSEADDLRALAEVQVGCCRAGCMYPT